MHEWMDEWMNRWMGGWMDEWINEWKNERMNQWMNQWMAECILYRWVNRCWMNEWIDECPNESMNNVWLEENECMDEYIYTYIYLGYSLQSERPASLHFSRHRRLSSANTRQYRHVWAALITREGLLRCYCFVYSLGKLKKISSFF